MKTTLEVHHVTRTIVVEPSDPNGDLDLLLTESPSPGCWRIEWFAQAYADGPEESSNEVRFSTSKGAFPADEPQTDRLGELSPSIQGESWGSRRVDVAEGGDLRVQVNFVGGVAQAAKIYVVANRIH